MRKAIIFALMFLSFSTLAVPLVLFYLDDQLNPVIVREEIQKGSDILKAIFDKLSSPPNGLKSFVPKDALRAYFFVEKSLVIDLRKSSIATFDFTQERFFVHQLLRTIFENFPGIDAVYFLLDGSRKNVLVNMVDIRFGFARYFWVRWPVEGE